MNNKINLGEHEKLFNVRPIGVKYICEYCGEGEMIVDTSSIIINNTTNPTMIRHKCNKCNGTLLLPKSYPYIYWDKEELVENSTDEKESIE
jgi:ssDNA-binding Zn-finger/Zn-ribbon topoisomerase 1